MSDVGLKGVILNAIGKLIGTGPVDLADQLVQVDKKLQEGTFDKYPSPEWADGVSTILAKFADLASGGGFIGIAKQKAGSILGTIKDTAQSIVDVSKKLSEGVYKDTIPPDWASGVASLLKTFSDISNSTSLGNKLMNKLTGSPFTAIAQNIVDVSKKLSEGKYTNGMPGDYMSSLANNIKSFIDLSNFLDNNKVGNIDNSVDNMKKISTGYSELAKGLSKLGGELNKIDTDKLQALKNLTGSIVLMSLMDSDQFEKMMSALEDKAKIFVGVMNDLDAGESSNNLKTGTSAVKTPTAASEKQATITDLYNIMSSVDRRLSSIAKSNDNVSKYVDEIRTSDTTLKKDKKK